MFNVCEVLWCGVVVDVFTRLTINIHPKPCRLTIYMLYIRI